MTPQAPDDKAESAPVGRLSIDKQFHGDLEATSMGQMLAVGTDVEGSAGTSRWGGSPGRCMVTAAPLRCSTVVP